MLASVASHDHCEQRIAELSIELQAAKAQLQLALLDIDQLKQQVERTLEALANLQEEQQENSENIEGMSLAVVAAVEASSTMCAGAIAVARRMSYA
ncbi:hypothetical protein A0H81_01191 [Grifola frondosa]|uniref:Uncharacterized protein n=1 Tax=Grifola frondosa TaxID=5627 RepID=A0A1C7MRL4_GRIFR|nr:hypothetical protein A0H81_01191 [Grifola frondosa]